MSTRKTYTIHCDGAELSKDERAKDGVPRLVYCDAVVVGDESEPVDIVRYKATGAGWHCDKSTYDYCPSHVPVPV